ncbi:MAG: peptide ABC transporter substrate-binding protein [Legionellales bacterium RIFCSPHIGHO2_12_FULL_37_14]|nr:MAG: peptide ABC transporter substrate-binding protein [Legionellales bacterium RIFCSPHIGHO2_12_FULL_37_14]
MIFKKAILVLIFTLPAFAFALVLNNPYKDDNTQSIYYSFFPEAPKTLDPAKSYNVNESLFIGQITEPLLEYHYYKRPYTLVPLIAAKMPEVTFLAKDGQEITKGDEKVAYSVYHIQIKPNILFQPHPAFAKCDTPSGYCYSSLSLVDGVLPFGLQTIADFKHQGTRALTADDFIYQIKRLADPHINSPIYALMESYIVGFKELNQELAKLSSNSWIDLRKYDLKGVKKLDDLTFEIRIYKQYKPFLYWLAMHFFVPTPWEVDRFYALPSMKERNIGFDWNPVGTGPFLLKENNPNSRMVLERNPNFRLELFPADGSEEDKRLGYMQNAGKKLPMIDKAVYTLEKEAIPRWNKFLQGYYDVSGISADSFDQAIHINSNGKEELTEELKEKKITLFQTIDPSIFYYGFNMLDSTVGGDSERARLLRLAISLAINIEERIALFYNGRGKVAQGPIPLGIFGHEDRYMGYNDLLYEKKADKLRRKSIKLAKKWLNQAGYVNGIDPATNKPLLLNYDVTATSGPDEKAELEWMRKKFAQIGISLNIRATHYNRFQEKMRTGNSQIFSWGWKADYPDPENFLFLLYGPNGQVETGGENAANYHNAEYDKLFDAMKNKDNTEARRAIIAKMLDILHHDAPWVWGLYTKTLTLRQQWVFATKPNAMAMNTLKYLAIDPKLRAQKREEWNQVIWWPFYFLILIGLILLIPMIKEHKKQELRTVRRFKGE